MSGYIYIGDHGDEWGNGYTVNHLSCHGRVMNNLFVEGTYKGEVCSIFWEDAERNRERLHRVGEL